MGLLGDTVILFFKYQRSLFSLFLSTLKKILENLCTLFHRDCTILHPANSLNGEGFHFPHMFAIVISFLKKNSNRSKVVSVVLICLCLMIIGAEHLFICLLVICVLSLEKCLFKSCAHLKNQIIIFFSLLNYRNLLCTLETIHRMYGLQIFSAIP